MTVSDPPRAGCEDPSTDAFQFAVFTVSAVDFQKLEGLRTTDGPPKAFSNTEDTEIPALREFVHRTARACVAQQVRTRARHEKYKRRLLKQINKNIRDAS
eukprot:1196197-Prorocentrum_minimum.AAC.4